MNAQISHCVAAADDLSGHSTAATELVDAVTTGAVDCISRSVIVRRLSAGTLPFAGRAAWLEQHWEGLRILQDCPQIPSSARHELIGCIAKLSSALDRAHAGARWRDRHVTMPSMLTFRRHVTALREKGDIIGLAAQSYILLTCAGVGSGIIGADADPHPTVRSLLCSLVTDDEDLERLSEELSAGLLMFMQHGSDVCRAYQESQPEESCAVTVDMIRHSLR